MPTSPRTPSHSRGPSATDLSFATPLSYSGSPRRHSKGSINTPISPGRNNRTRTDSIGPDVFSSGGPAAPSNGLGNLADELADAWEEGEEEDDEDYEPDMNFQEVRDEGNGPTRDSGVDVGSSPVQVQPKSANLTPPTPTIGGGRRHRRQPSEYDGSDYGGDSDLESPGMPTGLLARMDMVDSLARRGAENNGTDRESVVKRVIDGLKDLGGQSGVEGNATRLITAHSALSTHLHHQTRLLQSLAYPLFSPGSIPPDEEFINELMPLLVTTGESMPRPTAAAFQSLDQLHSLTADLVHTLNYLSDTLHMSRQTTATAARRLKSTRELVAEMRKEEEAREEGEIWLKRHNWGERLGARECAGVCGDVVGGFEEVCNGWRARLIAQADAVPA
ncbi:uncharacterized protein L3040_000990 [Drepanopeziza brunnea f. sp. 'multigermtubi']|uniref:WD domain-containing protein n=1 Tax=Marssonina brunnea f. sp. multigermtubi (strain MB_m1) TaxID=1072389 RepID=K1X708_MARBU|nr:uncharacterized protein MBM_01569 [Drepanopeziza brunnea f. sp. 'multigermtubi' MB_m1]EKD20887.1 hypothetical protein MBM_01569 [Drepanopeziza brunnea f. sp. 'multigermtubi' MB_m1]KAJ5054724.1 hypothetical protein L3040_000990 [Drepanopeziza brunnea f. sp. 'multigermtubi']